MPQTTNRAFQLSLNDHRLPVDYERPPTCEGMIPEMDVLVPMREIRGDREPVQGGSPHLRRDHQPRRRHRRRQRHQRRVHPVSHLQQQDRAHKVYHDPEHRRICCCR
jgi:hypothetical protein